MHRKSTQNNTESNLLIKLNYFCPFITFLHITFLLLWCLSECNLSLEEQDTLLLLALVLYISEPRWMSFPLLPAKLLQFFWQCLSFPSHQQFILFNLYLNLIRMQFPPPSPTLIHIYMYHSYYKKRNVTLFKDCSENASGEA